jgi:pimeloyl-ACP methyl ester carboxylesterase
MTLPILLLIFVAALLIPIGISIMMEFLRKKPKPPENLYWDKSINIQYLALADMRIRYIKTGQGPNLVMLHTLRTQLDIFEKVIPKLSKFFTVYALDLPGHGFSSMPNTDYVPELFVNTVEQFMEELNIENATVSGVSIGGTISLLMAAKNNPRIQSVVSINPYDYGNGRGVERGNFVAWLIFSLSRIPIVGETVMRFRMPIIEKMIFQGGVVNSKALTEGFLEQVWQSGIRKNYYRHFLNLIRHASTWEQARSVYGKIKVPVVLIYGDNDWSMPVEREQDQNDIPTAETQIIKNGGHFLTLDSPNEIVKILTQSD